MPRSPFLSDGSRCVIIRVSSVAGQTVAAPASSDSLPGSTLALRFLWSMMNAMQISTQSAFLAPSSSVATPPHLPARGSSARTLFKLSFWWPRTEATALFRFRAIGPVRRHAGTLMGERLAFRLLGPMHKANEAAGASSFLLCLVTERQSAARGGGAPIAADRRSLSDSRGTVSRRPSAVRAACRTDFAARLSSLARLAISTARSRLLEPSRTRFETKQATVRIATFRSDSITVFRAWRSASQEFLSAEEPSAQ